MSERNEALICLVDWVGVTLKTSDLNKVYEILDIEESEWIEAERGMHGYTKQKICGGIRILYAGRADMGVHIQFSGQGCREYETFYDYSEESADYRLWEGLLERLMAAGAEFSRLDLAVDEIRYNGEEPFFTVSQVIDKTKAGETRSKFRNAQRIEKIKIGDGSSHGNTIYFGSSHSLIQLRVYEKDKERQSAGKELEDDLTTWNRFELQLADDRAQTAIEWLRDGLLAGELIFGILSNYLNFVTNNGDSNKARWPICDWWLDWLDDAAKLRLAKRAPDKTIESKLSWLDQQTYPTIAEVWCALGSPGEAWFQKMLENGMERMTEKQWQRAEEYRNRMLDEESDHLVRKYQRYAEQQEERMERIREMRREVAAASESEQKEPFADGSDNDPRE